MNAEAGDLQSLLEQHFGFREFKPGQSDVISRLLSRQSTLAVFPTGGGKSLCYQLPALSFDGLTVVVSPLIALMKDQIDQLHRKNISAVRLDSSLTFDEHRDAISKIRSGTAKLLYVAPERFFNERFRGELEGTNISLFAIDEAHCISQWGHNFRPDYLKLGKIINRLDVDTVLCLTATAAPPVQQDICQAFDISDDNVICTPFYRPNLHLRSQVVAADQRDQALIESLKNAPSGATIIYVTLQKTAQQVAEHCQRNDLEARFYHAGLNTEDRAQIQDWFMQEENPIVVATIAFGMGIDKSNIRYVYHYNPPKSIESYAQEIGRAGRDGQTSVCRTFLVPEDSIVLENFVFGDTPSEPSIRTFIDQIAQQPDEFFISPIKLSNHCDIRSIVTKTLLTYLELDGYLESTAPRYESYRFKPNITGAEIIANFNGDRQDFVRGLLKCCQKQQVWFSIDLSSAMEKLNCDRMRIVKALDYFSVKGWIELKATGLVHGYRKRQPIADPQSLAIAYHEKVTTREKTEIQRTRQFLDIARANRCQAAMLSNHFGQPMESSCGHCSFCIGDGPFEIPNPLTQDLAGSTIASIQQLATEHVAALNSPRAIARFLCGITSPALTRAKLSRDPLFGSCETTPFDQIMQQVESNITLSNEPPF